MARQYTQGKFKPRNPQKYVGDPTDIVFRSSWELKYSSWCDLNPNVIQWSSETVVINYIKPTDGRVHRYFVDYWMKIKDKQGNIITYLVEVKPYAQTQPPVMSKRKKQSTLVEETNTFLINQAKWKYCREYCAKRGWKFIIITEKELGLTK